MAEKHECGEDCDHNHDAQHQLQQKFAELQMMAQQHQQMQKHMEQVDTQVKEVATVIESLNDFKEVKDGTELLVPLTNGIFAQASLTQNKTLLMNVGGGTVVEKSVDEACEMLKKQETELMMYKTQIAATVSAVEDRLQQLQMEMQGLNV